MKSILAKIPAWVNAILFLVIGFSFNHYVMPHFAVNGVVLGMALTAQLTTAWRAQIESYLDKASVYFPALGNSNYEGEAKENAVVKILTVGDVSVDDYTGAWNDNDWDDLATTSQDFTLDQKKVIRFKVADTDQYGSAIKLIAAGSERAAYATMNAFDAYIASLYSSITTNAYGDDTTPIVVGFDAAANEVLPSVAISKLRTLIAGQNGDLSAPNIVVPVWLGDYLFQELTSRNTQGGDTASKSGVNTGKLDIQPVAGYAGIYASNNVPNTTGEKYKIMAGTPKSSITVARAIDKIETGRLQNDFADFVKGLMVYGGKIPFEKHMALGTFNQGTPKV